MMKSLLVVALLAAPAFADQNQHDEIKVCARADGNNDVRLELDWTKLTVALQ